MCRTQLAAGTTGLVGLRPQQLAHLGVLHVPRHQPLRAVPVPPHGDIPGILHGSRKAEQILPYFILNYLPQGILGLVIAAALAAAMSSLDSSINSVTTVFVTDIYKRHLAPGREDRHYLRLAWIVAVVVSVLMVLGALAIMRAETKTLQDTATILVSLFAGGLLGLYLYGFLVRGGDSRAVWIGIAVTMAFTAWTVLAKYGVLPPQFQLPFDLYYTGLVGNVLMFATIAIAARMLPARATG